MQGVEQGEGHGTVWGSQLQELFLVAHIQNCCMSWYTLLVLICNLTSSL
jgi:hypothetical protein